MSFSELLGRLDRDPRVRGRQFERICKWYLENAPEYRTLLRRVWLWDDWEPRWGSDAGIDLVAEDRDGALWAVQAKVYDPGYSLKKRDLDSFISESGRTWGKGRRFGQRLLIATTDHLGKTARETLAAQEPPVLLRLRSQLEAERIEWPASPDVLVAPAPTQWSPRPHQEEAIAAVLVGFESASRGQLLMACGTGKTLVGLWVAERLRARRPLVLVPSLSLLKQTLDSWLANASEPLSYLAVCSDPTVARGEHDEIVMSSGELGIPVTTDPMEIAGFLSGPSSKRRLVVATYQSSPNLTEAQTLSAGAFDLVIADEAHRCAGPAAGEFAAVLDDERIRAARRLFMTATPKRFTGRIKREGKERDWEIASMDDEARFGPIFHRLSFSEAIERDLLSDYQVVIVGVNDSSYRGLAERGAFVTRDGETVTDARTLAAQIGLVKAIRGHDLRRLVSFHGRIQRASAFASELPDLIAWLPEDERPNGTFRAEHVSGLMTAGERERRLARLKNLEPSERALLANARCLGEGVDVPTLDGIAFIDPRSSQTDIVQAVGRAIRKADDKTVGTVILPVFVEQNDDPDLVLSSSAFKPVWDVLKALRAHDDALGEELDSLRRELGRNALVGRRPSKIHVDLPIGVGVDFAHAFSARLVLATTLRWHETFGQVLSYFQMHGAVPSNADEDHEIAKLGWWCVMQRQAKKRGLLPIDLQRLLEDGVAKNGISVWSWDVYDDRFRRRCAEIREYRQEHGRCPPVTTAQGQWLRSVRLQHRKRPLESWKQELLNATGCLLDQEEQRFLEFQAQCDAVHEYRERHDGRLPSERDSDKTVARLASWRGRTARQIDSLSPREREAFLSANGPVRPSKDSVWRQKRDEVLTFAEQNHRLPSQKGQAREERLLAAWIGDQRQHHKRRRRGDGGPMTEERVRLLMEIPGWTWEAKKGPPPSRAGAGHLCNG